MLTKHPNMWLAVLLSVTLLCAGAFATTHDETVGGTIGYSASWAGKVFLAEKTLDFSSSDLTGTSGDTYQAITVPTGTWVVAVGYEIMAGEDGTCTIDVGDGSDPDGYFDGANVETGQTLTACSRWTLGSAAVAFATNVATTTGNFGTALTLETVALTNMSLHGVGDITVVTNVTLTTSAAVTAVGVTTSSAYPITAGTAYSAGVFYSGIDTIDVLLNNDADKLKIVVRALMIPMGGLE